MYTDSTVFILLWFDLQFFDFTIVRKQYSVETILRIVIFSWASDVQYISSQDAKQHQQAAAPVDHRIILYCVLCCQHSLDIAF